MVGMLILFVLGTLALAQPVEGKPVKKTPTPTIEPSSTPTPEHNTITGYEVIEESPIIPRLGLLLEMSCPEGKKVLSGSWDDPTRGMNFPSSHPISDGQAWLFTVGNPSSGDVAGLTFYIICGEAIP